MVIGTHNTMTYLNPIKWYYKPFLWMVRCQNIDIDSQYKDYNVRVFDIRLFIKNGKWYAKHGLVIFNHFDINHILDKINSYGNCWVQLVLEISKENYYQELNFKQFCEHVEKRFPNIKFIGGVRKYGWKCLYDFKNHLSINGKFSSSPKNPKIFGLFPKLYSLLFNKKFYREPIEEDCLMLDFINIT